MEGTARGMPREYMVADQRFAARRPDVLVYQTEVLETDLTVAGPIEVELHVATSGTDADWVVKIIDVYPNDRPPTPAATIAPRRALRRLSAARARRRFPRQVPRTASRSRCRSCPMNQRAIVVLAATTSATSSGPGHRLMVQIQSSWFPLFDRNPQTFVDINSAGPEDFQTARQRVYHSAERRDAAQAAGRAVTTWPYGVVATAGRVCHFISWSEF